MNRDDLHVITSRVRDQDRLVALLRVIRRSFLLHTSPELAQDVTTSAIAVELAGGAPVLVCLRHQAEVAGLKTDNAKLRDAVAAQGLALRQRAPKPPVPRLTCAVVGTACLVVGYVLGGA